ncbi:hypothetical protein ACFV2Q_38375 [Streptomyces sp. NPDC059650]|uniref:hypothetical protein n=1 Tax=Streptomyces sp. NPDC059650 TaxID=3346896 RepID=UPI0036A0EE7B
MRTTDAMPEDQARRIVYDTYVTGQPETTAAQLTGRSVGWVTQEYRHLARRGICPVAGQGELFDTTTQHTTEG